MIIRVFNDEIECCKAIKGADFIKCLDENGNVLTEFKGITNFSLFEVIGGDFTAPEPTEFEKFRADLDFVLMLNGEV